MEERDPEEKEEARGEEEEKDSIPGGEGLPPVPGGWTPLYTAPDRLTAIRIQGLLEELGFRVFILEEALGLDSPLSVHGYPYGLPVIGGMDFSDSHLVVPAAEAERAKKALEVVLREIEKFEDDSE